MDKFRLKEHFDRMVDDSGVLTGSLIDFGGNVFKSGRPEVKCNEETITQMAMEGCTDSVIADYFGVDSSMIRSKYRTAYQQGRAFLKYQLFKKQTELALAGNVVMLKWLGQHVLDQNDTVQVQHTMRNDYIEMDVIEIDKELMRIEHNGNEQE